LGQFLSSRCLPSALASAGVTVSHLDLLLKSHSSQEPGQTRLKRNQDLRPKDREKFNAKRVEKTERMKR
jgi:hypothetical protein